MSLIVGAVALSNGGARDLTTLEKVDAHAQFVIKATNNVARVLLIFAQDNEGRPIVLSDAPGGVFNAATGLNSVLAIPAGASDGSTQLPIEINASDIRIRPLDASSPADCAVVVSGLSQNVCRRINRLIFGSAEVDPISTGQLQGCSQMTLGGSGGPANTYYRVFQLRASQPLPSDVNGSCVASTFRSSALASHTP